MADRQWATQIPDEEIVEPTTLPPQQVRGGVEDVRHFERDPEEQLKRKLARMRKRP